MKNLAVEVGPCWCLSPETLDTIFSVVKSYTEKLKRLKISAPINQATDLVRSFRKALVSYFESLEQGVEQIIEKFDTSELKLWKFIKASFLELIRKYGLLLPA